MILDTKTHDFGRNLIYESRSSTAEDSNTPLLGQKHSISIRETWRPETMKIENLNNRRKVIVSGVQSVPRYMPDCPDWPVLLGDHCLTVLP